MKFWTIVFFISATIFFFLQTVVLAAESCPGIDSPKATAVNYQLYSAYQIGYGGYEAPCELKCFGNASCQKRCQGKEGLKYLGAKLEELTTKNHSVQCPSFTLSCLEQCKDMGVACAATCGNDQPLANRNAKSTK